MAVALLFLCPYFVALDTRNSQNKGFCMLAEGDSITRWQRGGMYCDEHSMLIFDKKRYGEEEWEKGLDMRLEVCSLNTYDIWKMRFVKERKDTCSFLNRLDLSFWICKTAARPLQFTRKLLKVQKSLEDKFANAALDLSLDESFYSTGFLTHFSDQSGFFF